MYFLDDGAVVHEPAFRVDAVDTLAAGDVWHGAFALGLAERMARARRRAIRLGGIGAQMHPVRRSFGDSEPGRSRCIPEGARHDGVVARKTVGHAPHGRCRRPVQDGGGGPAPADQKPHQGKARDLGSAVRDVAGFKLMLVEELQNDASAMLLDPHYALPARAVPCSRPRRASSSPWRIPSSGTPMAGDFRPRSTSGRWKRSSASAATR